MRNPSPIHPATKPDPAILAEVRAANLPRLMRVAETVQRVVKDYVK